MYGSLRLPDWGSGGRALELGLTEFRDPQAGVDVVEVDQAVEQGAVASHRAGLSSPGEGQIRPEALGVSSPEAGNFAALAVEIAAEFAGDVEDAGASAVVALKEHVVRGPEIVGAGLRHFILSDFPGMLDVGNIHDVADGAYRDAVSIIEFENGGEDLVAHKEVVLVAEDAVCAGQPTVSIKLVVVEVVLADQLGILRGAPAHAIADIEDDQSIAPVGQIGQPIFHLEVVQITPAGHRSALGVNGDDGRILSLPACDLLGMFRILEINDA